MLVKGRGLAAPVMPRKEGIGMGGEGHHIAGGLVKVTHDSDDTLQAGVTRP